MKMVLGVSIIITVFFFLSTYMDSIGITLHIEILSSLKAAEVPQTGG